MEQQLNRNRSEFFSLYLAFISTTLYPLCFAMTCARVVFPKPGGPFSRTI